MRFSRQVSVPGAAYGRREPALWEYLVGSAALVTVAAVAYSEHNPTLVAAVAELLFLAMAAVLGGGWNPLRLAMGADGRLSTSKFQFLMWTGVVIFGYVWLYATRYMIGISGGFDQIPPNVLLVMGFSATTLASAKGITTSYVNDGKLIKPPADQTGGSLSPTALISHDDAAGPDLAKVQMLVWTVIACAIYLVAVRRAHQDYLGLYWKYPADPCEVARAVKSYLKTNGLPDIDQSLMVLMGLGQGAYLAAKVATTTAPRLNGISPTSGPPATTVTLTGDNLGATGMVMIDGVPRGDLAQAWTPAGVKVTLPFDTSLAGHTVQLGLTASGVQSVNTIPFTVV